MKIKAVRTSLYDIPPQVERVDAIQAFVSMEFPFIEIEDADGVVGTGFSYTIGKGGEAIKQIMDAYLTPILLEEDAANIDRIWNRMWMETHWVGRGGIVGLGMAAVDIALWDLMAKRALYDIPPQVERVDAIQAFVSMEFPFIEIEDADGVVGTGFSYTIGKGGEAIKQIMDAYLTPILLEEDAANIDRIWNRMWMETHWVGRGGIVGLGMAAVDIALWDLMAKRAELPLYQLLGGARSAVPVYNTDGGWLHLSEDELVRQSVEFVAQGFKGIKIKVGRDSLYEDVARIFAVRKAIGQEPYLMIDANMKWNAREAIQLACRVEEADLFWFEEPIEADDVDGHVTLREKTTIPIAIGETIYNKYVFKEYIAQGAVDILQPDAVRVGGISEWMKVAHTAECFGLSVSPHFLMDLHVHLSAAVPHSLFVEYIPSLDPVLEDTLTLRDGHFSPPDRPGHGILFDKQKLAAYQIS